MQGKDATVGKFYLPPRVKQPLEVMELLRGKTGEGPITEVRIKNLVTSNEMNLPADYELGDEVDELQVEEAVAKSKGVAKATSKSKAKKEDAPKAAPPVDEKEPTIPEGNSQAAVAATDTEDTMNKTKKKAKKSGELRGRPKNGAPTRSALIDKMLAKGTYTCAKITDAVMADAALKVPKADVKKIRTLVSVRISRAQAAGGKYHRDKETKVVRVDFKEKPAKAPKVKKEKKAAK